MHPAHACPKCGAPLPADAPRGHCPQCLLGLALEDRPTLTSLGSPPPPGPRSYAEPPETETKHPVLGTRLGYVGDYELLEEIARGGMGVVYRARQSSLKRIVAVKMIRSGEFAGEAEVRRFRAEAEAAANLRHPNIVAIHEIGEHEGRHYFSMDFVAGQNLAQVCGGQPVAARQAAEWLKAIAEAVQFAHQRGVLHRDLKPQNILVDAEGRPHVTDFGLAKDLHADGGVTQTGAVMGSPSYMAPEQARGRNDLVGPASDVYSLGAVLYELLTGRAPFRGASTIETLNRVMTEEPARPGSLNEAAPTDLETICLKCLEKEPARRYPTARALAEDLGHFLAGEPVQARPASAARRAVSWARRHRTLMTAAASALFLALAGLAYGLWEQTQYLTWLNAHPGHFKAPGPRTAGLKQGGLGIFMFMVLIYATLIYRKLSTRQPWTKLFDPASAFAARHPVAPGWAALFGALGALGVVNALYFTGQTIEAYVWEDFISWATLLAIIYPSFFFGLGLLMLVVREQAAASLGLPMPGAAQLKPEQLASISAELFAGRKVAAVKLYREATGANLNVALAQVGALVWKLSDEQPGKFATDPTRFARVAVKRLIVTAIVCGAAIALVGSFLPERLLPAWPVNLAVGFGGSLCIMLMASYRKFWQRMLCILPVMISSSFLSSYTKAHNPELDYILPWMLGVFVGITLLALARGKILPDEPPSAVRGAGADASRPAGPV